jgi:carbonic anhydrase
VALALAKGEMNLHGWVYDIESGSIEAFDSKSNAFISLSDNPEATAT